MSEIAVRVDKLSKLYRIGPREPYRTLRETIARAATHPLRWLRSQLDYRSANVSSNTRCQSSAELNGYVWALRDVSFEVKQGEVIGIIGGNGAGKSTLLKILSKITEPTEGYAETVGRVGSLLEVGTGFHPELTGRENIYLNGAILGMKRAEIERKFDEIVAFAGTERFVDTPLKHYSTGMSVRLAFAVAAYLSADILLVDEVLAVGDAAFQKKCLGKMEDVARAGRTVLLVSHNMGAIRKLCNKVIWIDAGSVMEVGDAASVVSSYLTASSRGLVKPCQESEMLRIEKVVLRDSDGKQTSCFKPGEDIVVEIHFYAKQQIIRPNFWLSIIGHHGPIIGANMLADGCRPEAIAGSGILTCTIESPPLIPQTYSIRMGARCENGVTFLIPTAEVAFFTIEATAESFGLKGEAADIVMDTGAPVFVPYRWKFPDGMTVYISRDGRHEQMPSFSGG